MENIFIGTSGYSYSHWRGEFYPSDLPSYRFLEYYAQHFNTVELNVTFYRLPDKKIFEGWHRKTPNNFLFAIKGNRYITHIRKLENCKEELKIFFKNVGKLEEKLKVILWQLPPSLLFNLEKIKKFIENLGDYREYFHCFEFRNKTWFCKKIYDLLRENKMSLCSADWPDFKIKFPYNFDIIYIRRHGVEGSRLYSKCYSVKELKKDAKLIKKLKDNTKYIFVYFNNDTSCYAIKNAMKLKELISGF